MNATAFRELCLQSARQGRTMGAGGFGTLAEKRLHAVIKHYICPDEDFHEVGMDGTRYLADIKLGDAIYEVQTGSLYPMKKKLEYYLKHTNCTVTVVHPIAHIRRLSWVDPQSFAIGEGRRVAGERAISLLPELYSLIPLLQNERLRFRLLLLEVQDFRLQNGKRSPDGKRGSVRYERMPLNLLDELDFSTPEDFRLFLPESLPEIFTVKQFAQQTKLRGRDAYSAVRVLCALGLLTEAPPIGRAMAFQKQQKNATL